MTALTTIRASSLATYTDCSRRWAAVTLRREIAEAGYDLAPPPLNNIGAAIGTGFHAGAASMLIAKMTGSEPVTERQAEEYAVAEYEGAGREGLLMDTVTPVANDAPFQLRRMLAVYRQIIFPQVMPIAVERYIEVSIGDGFVFTGHSDVQTFTHYAIRDNKTGKELRTHFAQMGGYSLQARTKHPEIPVKRLLIDFTPRAPLKKPQPAPVVVEYDQATAEQAAMSTIQHIKADVAVFRERVAASDGPPPEHAFLANPGSMLCSPKYCSAFGTNWCQEHKKLAA